VHLAWLLTAVTVAAVPATPQVDKGICVLLGDVDGTASLALARSRPGLTIYTQVAEAAHLAAVGKRLHAAGLLGTRVFVARGDPSRLHLADNLADAVVVVGKPRTPDAELLRVLCPGGTAHVGERTLVKPLPKGADDWSHPFHGPDNNPASTDRLARHPYLTHVLSGPHYAALPQMTVASAGRVFRACGHVGKNDSIVLINKLSAYNGYNGTLLWQRDLPEGFMIFRNTMIATPEVLYMGDDASCKLIDTATGKLTDEIRLTDGPVWKWMALAGGVLYALVGAEEVPVPRQEIRRPYRGWSWWSLSEKGWDQPGKYTWGYGRTLLALDPKTKRVLWRHREAVDIDSRGVCMKAGRIYFYVDRNDDKTKRSVGCLDARSGKPIWRTSEPRVLEAIGDHYNRGWNTPTGFFQAPYVKCTDKALYFAGPNRTRVVAISTEDGRFLWDYPHGNYYLILRDDAVYALGNVHWKAEKAVKELTWSRKFEPLTGQVMGKLARRGACTRATANIDSIFMRGGGGTTRIDLATGKHACLTPMRPPCQDGVVTANGHLYWGPWLCNCAFPILGNVSLAPAGDFPFGRPAVEAERLQPSGEGFSPDAAFEATPEDWPAYRKDNVRSGGTPVAVAREVKRLWTFTPPAPSLATAPVTVGGVTFFSGSDGVVQAVNTADGSPRWTAYTGATVHFSPTLWRGRVYVGSGDGWVYCFAAGTGKRLWRFRAAPAERRIPVYGSLNSTWPVASGVLVEGGTAYAAAGITNYDGTHVYALDAVTGAIRWQNNDSWVYDLTTRRFGQGRSGVMVQGHLLMHGGKLYLSSGNTVCPAAFDPGTGKLLEAKTPRVSWRSGRDLFLVGEAVVPSTELLYAPELDTFWANLNGATAYMVRAHRGDVTVAQSQDKGRTIVRLEAVTAPDRKGQPQRTEKPVWSTNVFDKTHGLAVCRHAAVAVGRLSTATESPSRYGVAALDLKSGDVLWQETLPACPAPWGLAVDRHGRIIVSMRTGQVVCFGSGE